MRRYHHEHLVKMGGMQKQVPEPEGWGSGVQACLEAFQNISCNICSSHVLVFPSGILLYFHGLMLLFTLICHSSVPYYEPLLSWEIFFFIDEIVFIITITITWIFIHNYVAYISHLESYWSTNISTVLYTDTSSWHISHPLVFPGDLFDILSGIYIQERVIYAAEMHVGTMHATSFHQKLFKQVTVV
jgi:hypothetical protein